jgi:hypothetical protein
VRAVFTGYLVFTVGVLVQKGSPESKKPGEAKRGAVADFLNAALSSSKRTRPGSDPN